MVTSYFDEIVHFFSTLLYVRTFGMAADSCCLSFLIEIPDFASRMSNPEMISK